MKTRPVHFAVVSVVLLLAGLVTTWLSFRPDSPQAIVEHVAEHLARELELTRDELAPVREAPFEIGKALSAETTYPFFVYGNNRLRYWSDNTFVPPVQVTADTFDLKLLRIGRESYLLRKESIDAQHYVVSLITLRREYTISNDYLREQWNDDIFPAANFTVLEPGASLGVPVCIGNKCLFRISFVSSEFPSREHTRVASIILLSLALVALLAFINTLLPAMARKSAETGLFLITALFLGLRLLMTWLGFPGRLVSSDFFDPQIFASSSINASLGELFLNVLAIMGICIYLFRNFFRFRMLRKIREWNGVAGWLVNISSGLLILFAWLFPFIIIQTLSNNSSINLDISQSLEFDGLRVIALLTVLLSGVSAFLFSHPFISLLAAGGNRLKVVASFTVAVVTFALINEITGQPYLSSAICATVSFLATYLLKLYKNLKRLSYGTFAYLFVSIFFLSVNGAYGIQHFTQEEKIETQFRFASTFLIDRDIFAEYLLHEASEKIAGDAFVQTRIMSPFLGKDPVRQKIRQLFLPSYFNKYEVAIYIFNSFGAPADNSASVTFQDLVSAYQEDPYRTEYENIYFVTNPQTDITQKYLMIVPIARFGTVYGYVVVELSLKKIIPENVYPELLVDRTFQQFYHTQDLNYAVFSNRAIVFTSGDYNYESFFDRSLLGNTSLYTEGISLNGYNHIAQEDQAGRIAVVSSKVVPLVYKVANFSFLFVLGLLIILIMIFIQGLYNHFSGRRLFFSARIQLLLNLSFFVPLIIVSITTLGLTTRSSQQQLNSEYLNKSRVFGQQITTYLDNNAGGGEDGVASLTNQLADLAKLSNLDANIYSVGGQLVATSQPQIFESNLISTYINSHAYFSILSGENQVIEAEEVGNLRYFVAYTALKSSQSGALTGILGIPFFQSVFLLERVQTTILANILNIFAVIFIVLLVLSYFVSEWLTFPLRFITHSLRRTSLTDMNNPLTWTASDEIGIMVKEYNSMLFKLSESKVELEHTQREKAWREIAQQVAHEIKNPLTPMKLTLQQLERALKEGNGSVEKTQRAIANLLSQVDTLNEIASSFSGFAKMPEPVIVRLELIGLVRRVIDLHSPTGDIAFHTSEREIFILGDEQLLGRTFSNLILNGLQSGRAGQRTKVSVMIVRDNDTVRIDFRDNGKGIDPQIADRIFLPHFSTKKSGSGLGLAISRQAIHQMGGSIRFQTQINKGTTFTVELPVQRE